MTSTGPSGSALLGADHVGIIRVSGFCGRVRWEKRKTCSPSLRPISRWHFRAEARSALSLAVSGAQR